MKRLIGRVAGLDESQLRHLGSAEQLEERGAPRLARLAAALCAAFVVGIIAWSAITPLSEMSPSTGQVVPAGAVRVVQHLEGGILAELLVREGDIVQEGQPLANLAEAGSQSDYAQLAVREAGLNMKIERLKAFASEREPQFGNLPQGYPDLLRDQLTILTLAQASRAARRRVLQLTLHERQSELKLLHSQEAGIKQQIALAEEAAALREILVEKGLSSRLNFLDVKREIARIRGDLATNVANAQRTQDQISTATQRLAELDYKLAYEALSEMGTAAAELAQVQEQLKKQSDRVSRLAVLAPVAGSVKVIKQRTVGAVIAPGATFAEIVPKGEELVAETRIQPRDIGNLRTGQLAYLRVSAFDATRFGGIDGVVRQISASTLDDGDGKPYYKAVIELARTYVGTDPDRNQILPGMTVQVDVHTGTRTVLEYMAKPVKSAISGAFTER